MGNPVQYNDVLALRGWGDPERSEIETVPADIQEGATYEYQKDGYRVLPLRKIIPLVQTKGGQDFEKVVALVSIENITVEADPMGDRIITFGQYRVINVLNQEQSDKWMTILNNPLSV